VDKRYAQPVSDTTVHVRYMVDDVEEAVAFYTTHLGFSLLSSFYPAFADVQRGNLRLLLSGPTSSARRPMPDGRPPSLAVGTGSISWSTAWPPKSSGSAPQD
jgi:catechol 2,3-dioxygenase-like lactoylglutathione lyase family enzyme